jgi:hypothetical protein
MVFNLNDKLYKSIKDYCDINEIDIETYITNALKTYLMKDKYGEKPEIKKNRDTDLPSEHKENKQTNKTPQKKVEKKEEVMIKEEVKEENPCLEEKEEEIVVKEEKQENKKKRKLNLKNK